MSWIIRSLILSLLLVVLPFGSDSFTLEDSFPSALAREDEDEERSEEREEDDDDEEERENDQASRTTETISQTYTVIEKVTETIVVTPPEYREDRDGDGLVNALDPSPDIHQREFFTDDDGDSVANVYDRFPGSDDLVTFESETDDNANGIIDRYES